MRTEPTTQQHCGHTTNQAHSSAPQEHQAYTLSPSRLPSEARQCVQAASWALVQAPCGPCAQSSGTAWSSSRHACSTQTKISHHAQQWLEQHIHAVTRPPETRSTQPACLPPPLWLPPPLPFAPAGLPATCWVLLRPPCAPRAASDTTPLCTPALAALAAPAPSSSPAAPTATVTEQR